MRTLKREASAPLQSTFSGGSELTFSFTGVWQREFASTEKYTNRLNTGITSHQSTLNILNLSINPSIKPDSSLLGKPVLCTHCPISQNRYHFVGLQLRCRITDNSPSAAKQITPSTLFMNVTVLPLARYRTLIISINQSRHKRTSGFTYCAAIHQMNQD